MFIAFNLFDTFIEGLLVLFVDITVVERGWNVGIVRLKNVI